MRRGRDKSSFCCLIVKQLLIIAIIITSCCEGLVTHMPTQRIFNNHLTAICVTSTTTATADTTAILSTTISDDEQLVKQLGSAFAQKLIELEEYKKKHGNCLVPRRYEENPSLGNFVNKQRQSYRKYRMGEKSSINQVSTYYYIIMYHY
jgi:hypothetical protein